MVGLEAQGHAEEVLRAADVLLDCEEQVAQIGEGVGVVGLGLQGAAVHGLRLDVLLAHRVKEVPEARKRRGVVCVVLEDAAVKRLRLVVLLARRKQVSQVVEHRKALRINDEGTPGRKWGIGRFRLWGDVPPSGPIQ